MMQMHSMKHHAPAHRMKHVVKVCCVDVGPYLNVYNHAVERLRAAEKDGNWAFIKAREIALCKARNNALVAIDTKKDQMAKAIVATVPMNARRSRQHENRAAIMEHE